LLMGQRRGGGHAIGLHRQNAVRRWSNYGRTNDFDEQSFQAASSSRSAPNIDFVSARQRVNLMHDSAGFDLEDRLQTVVPPPLERFQEAARIIDGHAHLLMWIIMTSYLNDQMDRFEKVTSFYFLRNFL
uniref:PDEase domain-containing protein n=1 Tax=Gongylonema pulchrum TaxID=637853 RepID=A0A183DRK1_9BILA